MTENAAPRQTAVWYFIAATFIFVTPVTVFGGSGALWLTIVSLVAGGVVFGIGVVFLRRELRAHRSRDGGRP